MPVPAAAAPAPPIDTIGLDLHKRERQRCILAADGAVTERRVATSRPQFSAVLGGRPAARVLLEASTESEWVARHLESLGHEVVVADPNYAPMLCHALAPGQDGQARRAHARRGVPPGGVPPRVPPLRRAAPHPGGARGP